MPDREMTPSASRAFSLYEVLEREFEVLNGDPGSPPSAMPTPPSTRAEEADRMAELRRKIHERDHTALCISGGGIRSATFALGVLQGLARRRLLGRFHYLSTVSGGGYIGGWLSSWILRQGNDIAKVEAALGGPPANALEPEPAPLVWLRSYSNFLTPRVGLLSVDTWTLFATYLRNLLIHWSILLPLLAAIVLVPRVGQELMLTAPRGIYDDGAARSVVLLLAALCTMVAIGYIEYDLPSGGNRRQSQGRFLRFFLAPLIGAATLLALFWTWNRLDDGAAPSSTLLQGRVGLVIFMVGGVAMHVLGWLGGMLALWLTRPAGAKPFDAEESTTTFLRRVAATIAGGAIGGGMLYAFSRIDAAPQEHEILYFALAVPALLGLFLIATFAYVGIASRITTEDDREWWARASAWVLIAMLGWSAASLFALEGPRLVGSAIDYGPKLTVGGLSAGGIAGFLTALGGYLSKIGIGAKSDGKLSATLKARLSEMGLKVGVLVFALSLVLTVAYVCDRSIQRLAEWLSSQQTGIEAYCELCVSVALATGLFVVAFLLSRTIGINRFSLHAMYGNRLVRAYLGATRNPGERKASPFMGLDPCDNPAISDLGRGLSSVEENGSVVERTRLFPVVNAALNLVRGKRLAWQQRKAESFTFSPLFSGSCVTTVGYRESSTYGGENGGMSLGKAMTISGAAASPSMGYHSSTPVAFLMTVFNVRLGWWLGNPGPAGAEVCRRTEPRSSIRPLLDEALGLTTDDNPYVYLSDGGHFENLALYEMVVRRCKHVVVLDGGCDPDFAYEDLTEAMRKIRADLGISITLDDLPQPMTKIDGHAAFALGTIHYSEIDGAGTDGRLLYVKPLLSDHLPQDVRRYGAAHTAPGDVFPHQSTADQWFDEQQFESYRTLGRFTIDAIAGRRARIDTIADLFAAADRRQDTSDPEAEQSPSEGDANSALSHPGHNGSAESNGADQRLSPARPDA
jgi:hypothetical protein